MAALTVASIYIPMALSLASNLAHAPPISGLYSFVIHPLVYAILGSCPLLVVGPEAAGSLLTGAIVKASVMQGNSGEDDPTETALIVGVATALSGGMILIAGLTRLGFLDNVLSRPFLRGFITAIGFVIFVDQLVPELGLAEYAKETGVSHGTSVEKLIFIFRYARECHGLTAIVSIVSFSVIMMFRYVPRPRVYNHHTDTPKNFEKDACASYSPGNLFPRPVPGCCPVGSSGLAPRLGIQRPRNSWTYRGRLWGTIRFQLAFPACEYETCSHSIEQILYYRATWVL